MAVRDRLSHAWNAFLDGRVESRPMHSWEGYGATYSGRPDQRRLNMSNERSIIASIYTRIAIDVASTQIRHVVLDDNDRYLSDKPSGLNECLKVEANLDQGPRAFVQDIVMTLFDKGHACIVPVETSLDPAVSSGYDIRDIRVGEIVQWMPRHVRVSLYNDERGRYEEVVLEKRFCAIIYNPLHAVMNEPNSTLQRLIRKINLLDMTDEKNSSGKLDLLIQLPYTIKTETRRQQAELRRKDIEMQLTGSKYGIAYTDGTEKVTQLNRPVENNLFAQVKELKEQLYSELGITASVMDGTADEAAMLNYYNRTVEPILGSIVEAMRRAFLTKTARSQKQSIVYFRDPFKLVPLMNIAEIADKFTRNEIMSSNELRSVISLKPSSDPKADELRNSNMPAPSEPEAPPENNKNTEGDSP